MDEFDRLNQIYIDKFGDIFPTMCFMADSIEELANKIQSCIEKSTRAEDLYDLSYEEGIVY